MNALLQGIVTGIAKKGTTPSPQEKKRSENTRKQLASAS